MSILKTKLYLLTFYQNNQWYCNKDRCGYKRVVLCASELLLSLLRLLEQYHKRYIWISTNEFRFAMSMWICFNQHSYGNRYIIFVVVLKTCIVRKTSLRVFKLASIGSIGNRIICPFCHSICVKTNKCTNELLVLQISRHVRNQNDPCL